MQFFARNKRTWLLNSRFSDSHKNAIEEDNTDEN